MPTSQSSPRPLRRRAPAKKPLRGAQWKPLGTMGEAIVVDTIRILRLLKTHYPEARCELDHRNPYELLVATILSAQCTDVRVNIVTKDLFQRFPSPKSLSLAELDEIENLIRTTGFFKNKAKNIKVCAQRLVEQHRGQVPQTMEELVSLPGVGRKTANVVLGNAFHIASGIVVDTHVMRLSQRFGWTRAQDPVQIEAELNGRIPQKDWIEFSHLMIWHGRKICKARRPGCQQCFLFDHCPRVGV